jgi:branched-chain amino acid transport system permease protein
LNKKTGLAVGLAVIIALPWILSGSYPQHLMIMVGLAVMLAVSNRLILVSGAWFMGMAAFYAIGAYGVVLLRTKVGLDYWFALPLAGLMASMVALLLGYATSRVKGIPFAIISVAFVEVVRLSIIKIKWLGGHKALTSPPPEPLLGLSLSSKVDYYYFILFLVLLTILVLWLIERSPVGAALKTIAENESLAESLGVNSDRYKVVVLAICAFFGGLAGGFYAPYVAVTGPTSFTLNTSIFILFNVVVGGLGSVWGPVAGSAFLTLLPELLPGRAGLQNILFAAIVLAVLFFLPQGLISLPDKLRRIGSRPTRRREGGDLA